MLDVQDEMLMIAKVLEKMGYHITEVYNAAGFLRVYIDGKEQTLRGMVKLWRKG